MKYRRAKKGFSSGCFIFNVRRTSYVSVTFYLSIFVVGYNTASKVAVDEKTT